MHNHIDYVKQNILWRGDGIWGWWLRQVVGPAYPKVEQKTKQKTAAAQTISNSELCLDILDFV